MHVLLDQFRIGEIAKRHALGDAGDFLVMAMKKITRHESLDRIPDKADGIDICVFVMIRKVQRQFVIGKAPNPGVATDDLADIFPGVLLGFQQ
jgi:hypothetical protein